MALRCLLVSIVASFGFDLPSGQDVTSWKMLGQRWVAARTVDLSGWQADAAGWFGGNDQSITRLTTPARTEVAPAALVEQPVVASSADLTFESISGQMAAVFAEDQAAILTAAAEIEPIATAESPAVASAELSSSPEFDSMALAFPAPFADSIAEEGDDIPEVSPAAVNRLNSAIRLTREAVQAWAEVVQAVGDDEVLTR